MGDAPEKKRRKLTTALKEAIGAQSQKAEENIEKPIALALISDNKSAQDLLNKVQASRRPQTVLETTLKLCKEKKSEAHVEEAFLSIFRKHFSILGIDSAVSCWKLIEEHLNESESPNEISIANEFINTANLLGHGFGVLLQTIKAGLPNVIQRAWKQDRKVYSLSIAYSFMCLILAKNTYGDNQTDSSSVSEYWKSEVLKEKSMRKHYGMKMISAMSGDKELIESLGSPSEISEDQLELLSKVFLNHLEFFSVSLHETNSIQLLSKVIETHLENNQLKVLAARVRSSEIENSSTLYSAVITASRRFFEISETDLILIEDLKTIKQKEVMKQLASISAVCPKSRTTSSKNHKKLEELFDFIQKVADKTQETKYLIAFSLLTLNFSLIFDDFNSGCLKTLKSLPEDVLEKLVKIGKDSSEKVKKVLMEAKASAEEEKAPKKFTNRSGAEIIEKLESDDVSTADLLSLLQDVHLPETRKEIFDSLVKFAEDMVGGESLSEIKLFNQIIEMYGGTPLESLALQIVFSRVAADGWTEMDQTPGTEKSDESWFTVLVEMISLLETAMKSAKSSIVKSYTAIFCQLFSQVLKNTQKFVRNSLNAVASRTLSSEMETLFVLRRHKLIQGVSRLVDGMKRNESYFSMLTASIIGDAVFYGSDSLLAMSKLHSLADKNASGLLATNLPVVERTRYKKFLSTITRASKRVY
uniref:U3 small nucleolar RNA-associated protein 10 n=1 Tax=Caenorhabditis tropicalis TaxID=1561998 RepID=A0A1I7TMS9_9PELO